MKSTILNSPYFEPKKHFASDNRGITENILDSRRPSSFYIPVPRAKTLKKKEEQNVTEGAFGNEMQRDNESINKIRERLTIWRSQEYPGLTKVSRDLLSYWNNDERSNKLFFCQIEALETMMYINEVAEKNGDVWIINELKKVNTESNPGLLRIAYKMATGSGKTVVMAMMIAYHTLNKARYPQDTRFTDAFVMLTPGITIRDRLNVLLPNDPNNYYRMRDLVPYHEMEILQSATVHIINYHQMELRQISRYKIGSILKETNLIDSQATKESPSAMVKRAFKPILGKSRVLVINDEAHHCYREKPESEKLTGEDKKEAEENNEAARVWISGIEALTTKMEVNAVIDLSATPYFLRGSGYSEGTLFPWVVSDFSLLDALEAGIVKIPRLPVSTDAITHDDQPEFRNLWINIADELPKKGMKTGDYDMQVIHLPTKLHEALDSLYGSYESYHKVYEEWKKTKPDTMPPVMIVVCSNTSVSEMVYRWISGFQKENGQLEKGNLELFRNEDGVHLLDKPSTLLIDSKQIESGEKINDDFKKIFESEITEFKKEYKKRFQGREDPTDEELLREVMNTVGKPGKLGESIKCVVSVSMLTEGWDVNTVTHVLGIRAFSTQLLCEQVVGRALRRVDYSVNEEGLFNPEYAEVYGVPFSFLRVEGSIAPSDPKVVHRVHAIPEREEKYEIKFPRVEGYRYEMNEQKLSATFNDESKTIIENEPTRIVIEGVIGEGTEENMEKIRERRDGEVSMRLAEGLLKQYFTDKEGNQKYWLMPQLKKITDEYVKTQVVLKDKMVIGYLTIGAYFSGALTKINQAIVKHNISESDKKIMPILAHYDTEGSTRYVEFLSTRPVQETIKSHVNYVVADTEEWEQGVAKKLEEMPEVLSYVKNQNLGFYIPYEHNGIGRQYVPDFIARLERINKEPLTLLIEVTGKKDDKKKLKTKTARELWVPAINNEGSFGEWAFIEIQDIHETQNLIRLGLAQGFNLVQ